MLHLTTKDDTQEAVATRLMAAALIGQDERPVYSIIAPAYNEEAVLPALYTRISEVMMQTGQPWELLLINDGSSDRTAQVIATLHEADPRVRGLSLARNFGFQVAVTCGLDHAQGQAVILIDADLQDPPEVILRMIEQWQAGYDVVYGVRGQRDGETRFKKWTAAAFYRVIQRITNVDIPLDTGDFRLMDRRVVEALRQMPERHRFLRGMVSWVGFKQTGVTYHRHARAAGTTKFTLRKMIGFALDAITGFSHAPLQVAGVAGGVLLALGGLWLLALAGLTLSGAAGGVTLSTALLLAAMSILGGVQLIALGIAGEYLGRMYEQVKGRPLYLVDQQWGIEAPAEVR